MDKNNENNRALHDFCRARLEHLQTKVDSGTATSEDKERIKTFEELKEVLERSFQNNDRQA